jgi:hypothetical protein
MQPIQEPNRGIDPQLATLEHIEELLDKIDRKLAFFMGLTILAVIWSFLT